MFGETSENKVIRSVFYLSSGMNGKIGDASAPICITLQESSLAGGNSIGRHSIRTV